jgi:hypothetical protein
MRLVASGNGEQWIADAEEAAVLAIQRFANAVGVNLIDLFKRTSDEVSILVSRDPL